MPKIATAARQNWFYFVLPVLLGIAFGFRATHPWGDQPQFGEAATLFDWCLFVPLLYQYAIAICLAARWRSARWLWRVADCGSLARSFLTLRRQSFARWGWLRTVGITFLVLAEGAALTTMLRIVFGSAPDPKEIEKQGMPPVLVKLMMAEARFWRWLWLRLKG